MSFTRLYRWFLKRLLIEDAHSLLLSILISILLLIFLSMQYVKTISRLIKFLGTAGVVSNVALGIGTLMGFLASVAVSTIASGMLFKDRSSKFIEIILAAPFSYREYLVSLTLSMISLGVIINIMMTIVYICAIVTFSYNLLTVMTNYLIYIVSLLITIITSLLIVIVNLALLRIVRRLRISGLVSTLPSIIIYLAIIFLVRPFHTHTTLWPVLTTLIISTAIVIAVLIILILKLIKPDTLLT